MYVYSKLEKLKNHHLFILLTPLHTIAQAIESDTEKYMYIASQAIYVHIKQQEEDFILFNRAMIATLNSHSILYHFHLQPIHRKHTYICSSANILITGIVGEVFIIL